MKANDICPICKTNHGATDSYPGDNPCCPNCHHYNAMLSNSLDEPQCRDCGCIDRGRCPECNGLMVLGSSGAHCLECRDCGLEIKDGRHRSGTQLESLTQITLTEGREMLCEWCEKRDATDDRGLCADCRNEMELDKRIHYRCVARRDAVGRIVWAVYTKTRKGTGWNYNQHVGNDNGRDRFVTWATNAGWIPEAR